MIGITFEYEIKKVGDHFLYTLFQDVSVDKWVWNLNWDDIYLSPCVDNSTLFNTKIVDGKTFLDSISHKNYFVIMCDLQAFPTEEQISSIATYKQYLTSSCQFVLIITDAKFVGILSKHPELLQQIKRNVQRNINPIVNDILSLDDDFVLCNL